MNDKRNEWKGRAVVADEDARSSHSEDAERKEALVNKRVMLSGENEPNQRSLFCIR